MILGAFAYLHKDLDPRASLQVSSFEPASPPLSVLLLLFLQQFGFDLLIFSSSF